LLQQGLSSAFAPVPALSQHNAKFIVASILSFSTVPPAGSQFCRTRYPAYDPPPFLGLVWLVNNRMKEWNERME
tara:strand:+ start:128 stop:349 length:222 start_codon:yes stop_codon:yes gene_type:complete